MLNTGTDIAWVIAIGLLTSASGRDGVYVKCPHTSGSKSVLYTHPYDCTLMYICVNGTSVLKQCSSGQIFSYTSQGCVWPVGELSSCVPQLSVEEIIQLGKDGSSLILPHPQSCQRYFNLTDTSLYSPFMNYLKQYEGECDYPNLFDVVERVCTDFRVARCGGRVAGKYPCDYYRNRCIQHCESCSTRLGSCEGKTDGYQVHNGRLNSPFYIECYLGRTMKHLRCENGHIFRADILRCIHASIMA